MDPASHQGEVAIHPDVRTRRDSLTIEGAIDDDEGLFVLAAGRVDQLVLIGRAGLPVGEDHRGASSILGQWLNTGREHSGDGGRVGPIVDNDEVADVVPGRRRDEIRAALWREGEAVAVTHC